MCNPHANLQIGWVLLINKHLSDAVQGALRGGPQRRCELAGQDHQARQEPPRHLVLDLQILPDGLPGHEGK